MSRTTEIFLKAPIAFSMMLLLIVKGILSTVIQPSYFYAFYLDESVMSGPSEWYRFITFPFVPTFHALNLFTLITVSFLGYKVERYIPRKPLIVLLICILYGFAIVTLIHSISLLEVNYERGFQIASFNSSLTFYFCLAIIYLFRSQDKQHGLTLIVFTIIGLLTLFNTLQSLWYDFGVPTSVNALIVVSAIIAGCTLSFKHEQPQINNSNFTDILDSNL